MRYMNQNILNRTSIVFGSAAAVVLLCRNGGLLRRVWCFKGIEIDVDLLGF